MTQKTFKPTDPEFLRLLSMNAVFIEDTPEKNVANIRLAVVNMREITDEDLDAIPDEGTRNTMKRWNAMFS